MAVPWAPGTAGPPAPASGHGGPAVPVALKGGAGRVAVGRGSTVAGRTRPLEPSLVGGRKGRVPRAAAET